MKQLHPERLRKRLYVCMEKLGVCEESCFHLTESLMQTSLRGIDSHGINLYPHYHNVVGTGRITKNPVFRHTRTGKSTAVFDADNAFGHHAGFKAMTLAVDIAKETGIGAVSVKNSTHFGAAAYFAFQAAAQDHIGLAFTNVNEMVVAHNATTPVFGTNPICVVAPMTGEGPFCMDMATSAIARNKMMNYKRTNTPLEPGWCLDGSGRPTCNPQDAQYLSPLGGYKGYGLSMVVELFCGMLSGGGISKEITPIFERLHDKRDLSQFFMSIDIACFQEPQAFKDRLKHLADSIRAMPALNPDKPVMIPGDPEKITFVKRSKEGIPVDDAKYDELLAVDPSFAETLL